MILAAKDESGPDDIFSQLLEHPENAENCALALEAFETRDIVRAALEAFGDDAAISTAFGSSGLCVLHMAQSFKGDVRTFYIDTGFSFPETKTLLSRWESERKLNIERVLPLLTPEAQREAHGDMLWARKPDACCAIRKVEPNQRALEGVKLWIAALRRDQAKTRTHTPIISRVTLQGGHQLLKLCPMVNWSQKDVWRYIMANNLPYNELHDHGYPSIGCTHCTRPVAPGGEERDGRWAGREKLECGLHLH